MEYPMPWLCPLCHEKLVHQEKMYCCIKGHKFDVAKEGYLNLLPVQHKRSREPGDNSEMIMARRNFLELGYYQPLRDTICDLLSQYKSQYLLDIGCGEGYYTSGFAAVVEQLSGQAYGLDVSKVAVKYAAKRYRNTKFCVASSQRLPIPTNSLDAIVRIFAPCNIDELSRVVKQNGIVITVTPGPRHLIQLKKQIYKEVKLHPETTETLPDFTLAQEIHSTWEMPLPGTQAVALLQMTPFAWRARPEVWAHISAQTVFPCEADFVIRVWQKNQ